MPNGKDILRHRVDAYRSAQMAMADLKASVLSLLAASAPRSLSNAEIGRSLGIYGGHEGHEGHISRTVLATLESEGLVEQNLADKRWTLRQFAFDDGYESEVTL